jgi:hypothetical protein
MIKPRINELSFQTLSLADGPKYIKYISPLTAKHIWFFLRFIPPMLIFGEFAMI